MDKLTDSDEVRIARNAADVLENEAYKLAMDAIRAQIVKQWKECDLRDLDGQRLHLQLSHLADNFEQVLAGYIARGTFAQHRIDIDKQRNESMGARVMRRTFSRQ